MKSKTIYTIIFAIVFIVLVVVWKLNSYYQQEKSALVEGQIHQQTITLKTSISSQMAQLKNIISSYQGQIDESKINWVQINPFFALAQLEIAANGAYTVKHLFVKSGTPADAWSMDYMQKAFALSKYSNQEIHGQLFQNHRGEKFLSLIFADQKIQNTRQAVALVGEANYFQKYFDTVRTAKATNLLMTSEDVIVGHTQSDYIATKSQEAKVNPTKYFVDKDEIRSSNLFVMAYASKSTSGAYLAIPKFVLIFVLGLAFLLIGILLYVLKPMENEQRKAEIFKKVFDEVQKKPDPPLSTPVSPPPPRQSFVIPASEDQAESLQDKVERELNEIVKTPVMDMIGKKKIALGEVIDLALKDLESSIANSGVVIDKHYESEKTYEIDVDRFRKAIENILLNAIEAQAQHMTIKVYHDFSESNHPVNVDIIDDGKGLEPGTSDKIWQPFYGTKDKLKHKGLGLSEALSVFRRYGADVRVVENLNARGVTVRIEMDAEVRRLRQPVSSTAEEQGQGLSGTGFVIDESREIDIDAILNLDDAVESLPSPPKMDLEAEFTTTQFKMDEKVKVVENPEIKVDKPVNKSIDHFAVRVRKPGRT